ncbi:MAG: lysophospholipid acyltransferase family protein [bacterium]
MGEKTKHDIPEREPGARRREILRWLYTPYCWSVMVPWLALSTVTLGALAVGVSKLSPRAAFHLGTLWAWLNCRVNWTWVSVKGRENAKKGASYVVMSNHQSQFDILAFYGHWGRQFRWVLKEELRKVPGIGWYCAAGGHVFIDRSDREKAFASLRAAKSLLDGGISVMFFPEGTRSKNGRMIPFKKGGFMMALQMGLPILPVSISGSRHALPSGLFRSLPGKINITIHEPIDTSRYTEETVEQLMSDTRAVIASGLTPWERGDEK